MANLAKQGRNLAFLSPNLAVTSPANVHKTLGLYVKARLARLEAPMPTHMRAHAHTRRSTSFAYRNGLEITSLDLANLARWFSALCERPTSLPNNARRCPQSRNDFDLAADCELATQRDTFAPVAPRRVCQSGTQTMPRSPIQWVLPRKTALLRARGTAALLGTVSKFCPEFYEEEKNV
jgi:hypothetical protein